MIPQDFIQQLLARIDIVEVVGRHVKLRRAGANFLGLCPFHGEKSPSFTVSPTKQFYHCFGCGAHGSVIGFLMEHAGHGYVEAIRDLAREAGMTVPEASAGDVAAARQAAAAAADLGSVLESSARFYRRCLRESPKAIEYLKRRSLTGETAARFGIGYAPAQWRALEAAVPDYSAAVVVDAGLVIDAPAEEAGVARADRSGGDSEGSAASDRQGVDPEAPVQGRGGAAETDGAPPRRSRRYDRFRDRIMFPIRNARGQVIGFGGRVLDSGEPKYLNSPETAVFSKGREVYGVFEAREAIRRENCVIVVEGYMDVVMLAQHGIANAVATLGTATTPDHLRKLVRLADRVVFAFDGDAAGRRAAWRALGASLAHTSDTRRIDFLFLPPEHDPDSFVREHGRPAWEEMLARTVTLSELLLRELSAQTDLNSSEGRALLLAQARPLVAELAAPALRLQIVHRLAHLSELSVPEVERYLAEAGRPATRGAQPQSAGARPEQPTDRAGSSARGRFAGGGGSARDGWRREASALRMPVAAPDLDARVRLLLAFHPVLAAGVASEEPWLPSELSRWVSTLAELPPNSTFANACERLRELDPEAASRLERASAKDSTGLSELSADEAGSELEGALAQLKYKWARQQIDALVAGGIRTDADRERYQDLLRMSKSVIK